MKNIKLKVSHSNSTKRRRTKKQRMKTIAKAKDFVMSKDLRSRRIGQKPKLLRKARNIAKVQVKTIINVFACTRISDWYFRNRPSICLISTRIMKSGRSIIQITGFKRMNHQRGAGSPKSKIYVMYGRRRDSRKYGSTQVILLLCGRPVYSSTARVNVRCYED